MSETVEQDVVQEVVTPDQPEADKPQEVAPVREAPTAEFQEKNWRAMRMSMEEQSHQIRLLTDELESIRRQQHKAPEPEEDHDLTETEKRLSKQIKELQRVVSEKEEIGKQREADYTLDRLRGKYADFDEVMDPENITYLKNNNAALAKAIARLKDDPYEQGIAAYEALKNTEWFKQRHTMKDKAQLEANSKKPVSVQAVRKQGPLSEANRFINGLTPELKKSLQQEMAQARKGA
jgi:uncharacterized coiled-coil protein SlyX